MGAKVKDDDMSGKFAWTVTIAALLLVTYSRCDGRLDASSRRSEIPVEQMPVQPEPELHWRRVNVDNAKKSTATMTR